MHSPDLLREIRVHTGVKECHQHLQPGKHHQGYVLNAKMTGQPRWMSVGDAVPLLVLRKLGGGEGVNGAKP